MKHAKKIREDNSYCEWSCQKRKFAELENKILVVSYKILDCQEYY